MTGEAWWLLKALCPGDTFTSAWESNWSQLHAKCLNSCTISKATVSNYFEKNYIKEKHKQINNQ